MKSPSFLLLPFVLSVLLLMALLEKLQRGPVAPLPAHEPTQTAHQQMGPPLRPVAGR